MKIRVFDADYWYRVGHDIGDNNSFWKEATVQRAYVDKYHRILLDVKFMDGRESRGHFATGIKIR